MPEVKPLLTLYMQIEHGETLPEVLGVSSRATDSKIRKAYRILAMRIHPDKAPTSGLRKLHTSLFQKVQSLYESATNSQSATLSDSEPIVDKPLPESWASLHARNIDAKEALKKERNRAVAAKQARDALDAAKKAKYERLADIRKSRAASGPETNTRRPEAQDWEQEEDRPGAESRGRSHRSESKSPKSKGGPQNQPTARTATPIYSPDIDKPLCSDDDIRYRWDKQLLSGGTAGSVSLIQKKQRENNVAARSHRTLMARIKEAEEFYCPNRLSRLKNDHLLMNAVAMAVLQQESELDEMIDEALGMIDQDVIEQHLLEDSRPKPRGRVGLLAIKYR